MFYTLFSQKIHSKIVRQFFSHSTKTTFSFFPLSQKTENNKGNFPENYRKIPVKLWEKERKVFSGRIRKKGFFFDFLRNFFKIVFLFSVFLGFLKRENKRKKQRKKREKHPILPIEIQRNCIRKSSSFLSRKTR